ncbi:MAG: divergent polysaccharide deacetylase family protein [Candidatus Cloacimonadales bacterium]
MSSKNEKLENIIYSLLLILFIVLVIYLHHNKLTGQNSNKVEIPVARIEHKASVLDAINKAAELLSLPSEMFSINNSDGAIFIRLGLDRQRLDLNYANAVITNQVDQTKGEVISGRVRYQGSQQRLEIIDQLDQQKYIVTLYYSRDYTTNVQTKLAIVVDDFGARNNQLLHDFCSLDPAVSFAILPDLRFSQRVMEMANETGHETLIHVPMEPISYPRHDPGPKAIYVHLSPREIEQRMNYFIEQFPLSVGVNNHMGSLATSDPTVMKTVLGVLKQRNLYFVDSRTSQSSVAYDMAKEMMIPTAENKLFLDTPSIDSATINGKLRQLEYLRKRHDKILVITHCSDEERYHFLKEFIKEAKKRNFQLVPVSDFFQNELPDLIS